MFSFFNSSRSNNVKTFKNGYHYAYETINPHMFVFSIILVMMVIYQKLFFEIMQNINTQKKGLFSVKYKLCSGL